jgi:hypothetical protein
MCSYVPHVVQKNDDAMMQQHERTIERKGCRSSVVHFQTPVKPTCRRTGIQTLKKSNLNTLLYTLFAPTRNC